MDFHMKTTLVIDDMVMTRLRECAAREGRTISELVESALRLLLDRSSPQEPSSTSLPRFRGGATHVDVANREALYRIFDEDEMAPLVLTAREPSVRYGPKSSKSGGRTRKKRSH